MNNPLPSRHLLVEIIETIHSVVFPEIRDDLPIEPLEGLLTNQIAAGLRYADGQRAPYTQETAQRAAQIARVFMEKLPEVQKLLESDVEAAYNGDPAAVSFSEIIYCYPCIRALLNYRVAHELYKLQVPLIPRMITELAHSDTGIDIHPAATIGHHFTIDHGTGVVIGATCIIGDHVTLYQGVTLGAKNFPLDAEGHPVKGIPRHPILEDNVIIYSNATVLGRITIGHDSVIGGNIWVTDSVPPHSRVTQSKSNMS